MWHRRMSGGEDPLAQLERGVDPFHRRAGDRDVRRRGQRRNRRVGGLERDDLEQDIVVERRHSESADLVGKLVFAPSHELLQFFVNRRVKFRCFICGQTFFPDHVGSDNGVS